MQDVICLNRMHFQLVDTVGVLEIDDVLHATDDVDGIPVDDMMSVKTVVPSKLEGSVTALLHDLQQVKSYKTGPLERSTIPVCHP